jgi:hypothetical protein
MPEANDNPRGMSMHPLRCRSLVVLVICSWSVAAQTLPVPPRPADAVGGHAFALSIIDCPRNEREDRIFCQIVQGNVPEFLRHLVPMATTGIIDGDTRHVRWYVTPEYVAVGSDSDYILMPMTPMLAQRIADTLGCILPTRKMVDDIYAAASVKLEPMPIPPSPAMTTVAVFIQHDGIVRTQRATLLPDHPLGELVAGHKKDLIISNAITTGLKTGVPYPVVIYGWHQLNGVPIQPVYNGHGETYADYSHGIRLVQRTMSIDTAEISVEAVAGSATLWPLVSDEGPIVIPRYRKTPD